MVVKGSAEPERSTSRFGDVQRRDSFGRTLAYVYKLSDGVFVNLAMARDGFVQQDTVPPNVAHAEEFRATVARPIPTTAAPAVGGGCHPSYSGACVPAGYPDVDCAGGSGDGPGDVSGKRFQVVGPDLYRLDSDGDGVACGS